MGGNEGEIFITAILGRENCDFKGRIFCDFRGKENCL